MVRSMPTVSDLFDVRYGHSLELNRLIQTSPDCGIPFVSRRSGGNGIAAYVLGLDGLEPAPAGELSCALSGNGVLSTFLQTRPFYTAFHVARLSPKVKLSTNQLLWYALCIKSNRYRYSYGRQANRSLKDIENPPIEDIPAYVYDADSDLFSGRNKALSIEAVSLSPVESWKGFELQRIFEIVKGRRLTKAQMRGGDTAFISALDNNNGLRQPVLGVAAHKPGVITVNYNGNGVAEAFFQPEPFLASDDVHILYPKFEGLTALSALFICAVIRLEKYRFSYGRKWNLDRMRLSEISLPQTDDGSPDLAAMERFMSTLRFSSVVASDRSNVTDLGLGVPA